MWILSKAFFFWVNNIGSIIAVMYGQYIIHISVMKTSPNQSLYRIMLEPTKQNVTHGRFERLRIEFMN